MRTWTLAFGLVTALTVLLLHPDASTWLYAGVRIAFIVAASMVLACGLRSLGRQLSAYESALPLRPGPMDRVEPAAHGTTQLRRRATEPHLES